MVVSEGIHHFFIDVIHGDWCPDDQPWFHPVLLREIIGNPFCPVTADPSWLAWNGRTAEILAERIYEERRFGDLPILADALEEAGCTDEAILAHCRQPGDHVRGCWVVDLLLGKT